MAIRRGPATAAYGHTQTHTQIETGRQTHLSLFLLDAIALGVAIRLGPATAARGRTQTHTHRERDRHAHTHLSIPSPPPPLSYYTRKCGHPPWPWPGHGCVRGTGWPLHDIVIANIVWCMAYKREVGGGVGYCPKVVQQYCTRVNPQESYVLASTRYCY